MKSQGIRGQLCFVSNKNYKNGDCTNVVSQALRAGSMPIFKEWKPYTNAWINACSFRNYILEPGGITIKSIPFLCNSVFHLLS
ncbi:amidase domain-containing protein [Bacillus sp. FSL K6-1005]|uniref:amidase domain-containing protein n=1 Tax=Bacillus sp. FSL K6-1005 TaxID=2954676 RepID=UPI004047CFFD